MSFITADGIQELWIDAGQLIERPLGADGKPLSDRALLHGRNCVKIEIGKSSSSVKWVMFAPNWSSMFFAREWLSTLQPPYTLKFFVAGWFEEVFQTYLEARDRIDQLLAKSDVRFAQRVFTRSFDPQLHNLIPDFAVAMNDGEVPDEKAVTCAIDPEHERTRVMHVGADSALASVWGLSPVAYPCLSGHSYDKIVSRPYFEVFKTGRPYHDHVLAAMMHPDGEVHWFGYQRLILPGRTKVNGHPTVNVLCHRGSVEIPVL
jgi:hypothetical protein